MEWLKWCAVGTLWVASNLAWDYGRLLNAKARATEEKEPAPDVCLGFAGIIWLASIVFLSVKIIG